jgi:hypothetical protein
MKKLLLVALITSFFSFKSQNVNLSNLAVFEGEPYLVINPTNPKNMVVAWMGFVFGNGTGLTIKVKSTFNSGLTWSSAINLPHMSPNFKSADVSMAFDATGKLFLSYIDYRESPDSGGVWVTKSLNGGLTWSTPVKVIDAYADGAKRPLDRPWIVCDNSGNNLYITTKPAPWIAAPNRPYFIASYNGGLTWTNWRYLDTTNYLVGNLIAAPMAAPAIKGNTVLAIYPSYVATQNILPQFILATSNNGGGTFNYKSVITSTSTSASNDTSKAGYKLLVNPTNNSHYAAFFVGGYTGNDLDILMTESFNAGNSWTTVQRINDDAIASGKMQDLVWADFDTNGDLVVTWRDRRNGSGPGYARATEIYGAFRANGSSSFTPNFVVSDLSVPHHTILEESGNDFMCVALKNDTLNTVWGTTRDGSLDIWFSRLKASTGTITSIKLVDSESNIINAFPNPSIDFVNISTNNNKTIDLIEIFDESGRIVFSLKLNQLKTYLSMKDYKSGIYQIKIHQGNLVSSKKIIKP